MSWIVLTLQVMSWIVLTLRWRHGLFWHYRWRHGLFWHYSWCHGLFCTSVTRGPEGNIIFVKGFARSSTSHYIARSLILPHCQYCDLTPPPPHTHSIIHAVDSQNDMKANANKSTAFAGRDLKIYKLAISCFVANLELWGDERKCHARLVDNSVNRDCGQDWCQTAWARLWSDYMG